MITKNSLALQSGVIIEIETSYFQNQKLYLVYVVCTVLHILHIDV